MAGFDYTKTRLSGHTDVSVGQGKNFETVRYFHEWLHGLNSLGSSMYVNGEGRHEVEDLVFTHAESQKVLFRGAPVNGGTPRNEEMTGNRAADQALAESRFNFVLDSGGSGDTYAGGLRTPLGLGGFENALLLGNSRYSNDNGFNKAHGNSGSSNKVRWFNVACFGSVWGLIVVDAQVRFRAGGRILMAYQNTGNNPGGAFAFFNSNVRAECPVDVFNADEPCKYAVHAEDGSNVLMDGFLRAKGPIMTGINAVNSNVSASLADFDEVARPITATMSSHVRSTRFHFANGDRDAITSLVNTRQTGHGAFSADKSGVFSGDNSTVSLGDGVMKNMSVDYGFDAMGGKIMLAGAPITADGCMFKQGAVRLLDAGGSTIDLNLTNHPEGSSKAVTSEGTGTHTVRRHAGLEFDPPLGQRVNGNEFQLST